MTGCQRMRQDAAFRRGGQYDTIKHDLLHAPARPSSRGDTMCYRSRG